MAALKRDKRGVGHILTKSLGYLLQQCGYKFWYWGVKGDYMKEYDNYGGRDFGRIEFFERWEKHKAQKPLYDLQQFFD
eukprot:CAMPEP_0174264876 /NCGR_PEP_ID=MMETSP0439-20130205/24354_1 /TAXON_ID=0 /ORGANISM="Stereomyxa ramosa, Strain Chinc5" /LENGTH=77 /DNA_ID=CAMNT_0015351025 /DNA_START=144 /DNA_END=374 /DNA_ORIENTATION=-